MNLNIDIIIIITKAFSEGFIDIWAMYVFSHYPLNAKRYLASSSIFIAVMALVNIFGINLGVKILVGIMVLTLSAICLGRFEIVESVRCAFLVVIAVLFSEMVNIAILSALSVDAADYVWYQLLPSTLFLVSVVLVFRKWNNWLKKRKALGEKRSVSNAKGG